MPDHKHIAPTLNQSDWLRATSDYSAQLPFWTVPTPDDSGRQRTELVIPILPESESDSRSRIGVVGALQMCSLYTVVGSWD